MNANATQVMASMRHRRFEQKMKNRFLRKSRPSQFNHRNRIQEAVDNYTEYNPHFEETANMVIAGLGIIIQRISYLKRTDPKQLKRLSAGLVDFEDKTDELPPEKASAVERLILSLLTEERSEKSCNATKGD